MSEQDREIIAKVREAMRAMFEAHQLAQAAGYGGVILEKFEVAERTLFDVRLDLM